MNAACAATNRADVTELMSLDDSEKETESVYTSVDMITTSIPSIDATERSMKANINSTRRRIQQRSNYSVKKKRELIALAQVAGVREVCRLEGVPRRTLRHWLDDAEKINSFDGPDSRKSIGRSGRREILPFGRQLTNFLEEGRRQGQEMTSSHMISFIRQNHGHWLTSYLADKKSAESGQAALARLCQRFVERHGLAQIDADALQSNVSVPTIETIEFGNSAMHSNGAVTRSIASKNQLVEATEQAKDEISSDDEDPLLFGLDIGTTAIKCVLVKADGCQVVAMANVSLGDVIIPINPEDEAKESKTGVQNVDQVLLAVWRAVTMLPETARRRAASIGICGQMHGIVWWCSRAVHEAAERLLVTGKSFDTHCDSYEPVWSELITWQDQRCTTSFLNSCREKIARTNDMGDGSMLSRIAAGYGLASFAYALEYAPRTLVGMDACGTIHDLVAFIMCGYTLPSETSMDTTNAHSWGGLNLQTQTWDHRVLRALQIPLSMLPVVKPPGTCIGHSCPGLSSFGLPDKIPVFVPMGDHPCSVVCALTQRQSALTSDTKITLVNIGTSAQMAIVLTNADIAKLSDRIENTSNPINAMGNSSFEVRPFLFKNRHLGVAASLSGGNTFAWLVQQWQQWAEEMEFDPARSNLNQEQAAQRERDVYARLIAMGLQCQDTDLTFVPTLNGERADPNATGSILNLRMNNWRLGDISAALSRGIVDNLFAMIPAELQPLVLVQPVIGTGNALLRNELLQRFLLRCLTQPSQLQLQTDADAAVGAALAPSLIVESSVEECYEKNI